MNILGKILAYAGVPIFALIILFSASEELDAMSWFIIGFIIILCIIVLIISDFNLDRPTQPIIPEATSYDHLQLRSQPTEKFPSNIEETLTVADEILDYCQQLENNTTFCSELSSSGIEIKDDNGNPFLGEGADVRRLFFIDIAHCCHEMNPSIDLSFCKEIGILYLLSLLHSPEVKRDHSENQLLYLQAMIAENMSRYVQGIADAPIFLETDEADFLVALLLLQYDHDEFGRYLTLLYRFCSLVAKADGQITSRERTFLDHLAQLRGETPSHCGNVTNTKTNSGGFLELEQLVGLDSVKEEVRTMANFIKIQLSRENKGLKKSPISYHCVFTGNPGTGKTTVARIIANIYAEMGVLKKGHLVETDRSGLVAEYVGQTAVKTNKVIDKALDGVLFIDEAYSLATGDQIDYGREAIATLLKRMEDDRDRLVVILAGYGDEMKLFIDSNPGLQSRFSRYIQFPDYSADELYQIFFKLANKYEYDIATDAQSVLMNLFTDAVEHKDKNFGNARMVRNIFEKTLEHQANRLSKISSPTLSQLREITSGDCATI